MNSKQLMIEGEERPRERERKKEREREIEEMPRERDNNHSSCSKKFYAIPDIQLSQAFSHIALSC